MHYILIMVVIYGTAGVSSSQQEYNSGHSCHLAAEAAKSAVENLPYARVEVRCTPKGTEFEGDE